MGRFNLIDTGIKDLKVIKYDPYIDNRGYFYEAYNKNDFIKMGINEEFVQDNISMSSQGVLRGLHFQINYPQSKLVRCLKGQVYDVAVDLRVNSETFGKYYGILLSEDNNTMFYIPKNFAHGFLVLSSEAELCYKVSDFYRPDDEGGLAWNDPEIGIKWPNVAGNYSGSASPDGYLFDGIALSLSEKDQRQPSWRELAPEIAAPNALFSEVFN